jgi:hypothetical protein
LEQWWPFDSFFSSPLKHHVTYLRMFDPVVEEPEHLHRVTDAMPHLTRLDSSLLLREGMEQPRVATAAHADGATYSGRPE